MGLLERFKKKNEHTTPQADASQVDSENAETSSPTAPAKLSLFARFKQGLLKTSQALNTVTVPPGWTDSISLLFEQRLPWFC